MEIERNQSVLVVDDDAAMRSLIRATLCAESFNVVEASSPAQAMECVSRQSFDLMTLDLNLGGQDGLAFFRNLRAKFDVPTIMVTAKVDEIDRVVGLEMGADDYLTKPFAPRELLARIRAVLRRYKARPERAVASENISEFGEWRLNLDRYELRNRAGELVPLTTAEFALLKIFAARPGRVMSRESLLELLKGGDSSAFDRSIDTLVARVRKKIERDVDNPDHIKTVRGAGYLFNPN